MTTRTLRHATRALVVEVTALARRASDALPLMRPERARATAARLRLVVSLLSHRDDTSAPVILCLLDDVHADLDAAPTPAAHPSP